ncbi:MAG: hypothetical protein ACLUIX_10920 [Oscillospiraceae bacterium]
MALAVCHLPLYGCIAALPGSSMLSHFNRTVRSAGGRGHGAVPVLRRKEYAFLEKEPLEVPPERVVSSGRWPVCCSVP